MKDPGNKVANTSIHINFKFKFIKPFFNETQFKMFVDTVLSMYKKMV